jgi:hypothetical protein
MRFDLRTRIAAAAVLLTAALVGLVLREAQARAQGQEVLLSMEAVDPRELLTGHYARLRLADRVPVGTRCPPGTIEGGGEWVALAPNGIRHSAAGTARTRAEAEAMAPLVVRGRASCSPGDAAGALVALDLGVDRFHAAQAQAEAMERALRPGADGQAQPAFAVLSIGRDGRARLKGVVVEGRRVDLGWL